MANGDNQGKPNDSDRDGGNLWKRYSKIHILAVSLVLIAGIFVIPAFTVRTFAQSTSQFPLELQNLLALSQTNSSSQNLPTLPTNSPNGLASDTNQTITQIAN